MHPGVSSDRLVGSLTLVAGDPAPAVFAPVVQTTDPGSAPFPARHRPCGDSSWNLIQSETRVCRWGTYE